MGLVWCICCRVLYYSVYEQHHSLLAIFVIMLDYFFSILAAVFIEIPTDTLAIPTPLPQGEVTNSSISTLWITLSFTLILNVICLLLQHFGAIRVGRLDVKNERKKEILKQRLQKEEELFVEVDSLRSFQSNQSHELLDQMEKVSNLMKTYKLFYSKTIAAFIEEEVLEYYKDVVVDFSKKDPKKEIQLMTKFYQLFDNV